MNWAHNASVLLLKFFNVIKKGNRFLAVSSENGSPFKIEQHKLYRPILPHRIKARTSLKRIQVMMPHYQHLWNNSPQLA